MRKNHVNLQKISYMRKKYVDLVTSYFFIFVFGLDSKDPCVSALE